RRTSNMAMAKDVKVLLGALAVFGLIAAGHIFSGDTAPSNSNARKMQSACKIAANEAAKYGTPKWPSFSFANATDESDGKVRLVEFDAQFQNGFGDWARVTVYCDYDLRNRKVIAIDVF